MKADTQSEKSTTIFYASPLIFAAACGLLAIIIAVFAVNNFQREKKLMELALKQEATAILNIVSAGFRSAVRRGFMHGEVNSDNWIQTISENIANSSEHPGLAALYLVDQSGVIRSHTDKEQIGLKIIEDTATMLEPLREGNQRKVSGIFPSSVENDRIFRIAMLFLPVGMKDFSTQFNRGRMRRTNRQGPIPPPIPPEYIDRLKEISDTTFILVAELSLENYRQGVKKQILQIVILSVVLLLVGSGGLLSLILIQTYKGSQKRLRSMSSFTDTLVSSLPLGLIATTSAGEIRTCNPSAAQMLNLNRIECIGKVIEEVLDKRVIKLLETYKNKEIRHWEMDFVNESGIEKTLHLTKLEIKNEEQAAPGVMLLVQDLSQIRALEDQLQRAERDAVVGRMAAGVAHELRNPLSSVKGLALLLKSRLEDDLSSQQTADLMVEEIERLNRTISELLDYARPGIISESEFEIDELLAKAVMLVQTDAEAGEISVQQNYSCNSLKISGDPDKLTQVILNLCLNGIQAMDSGGTIELSSHCSDQWVTIKVSDTGCGIPLEMRDKIFEPYFTTKHKGTGLGLAMSAKIISDHNGLISIKSLEKAGTTVTVKLPIH